MQRIRRIAMLAALSLAAFAATVATARAVTGISISPGGSITQVSLGPVTFTSGTTTITCRLTFNSGMSRTLVAINAVIGEVSTVGFESCSAAGMQEGTGFGWPMVITRLNGGALEAARAEALTEWQVKFERTGFHFKPFGGVSECFFGSTSESFEFRAPLNRINGTQRSYISGLFTMLSNSLGGEVFCPALSLRSTFGAPSASQTLTFL